VRFALLAGVVALGGFAFVGLMGNYALSESREAEGSGDLAYAEEQARTAIRWAPWSPEPWEALAAVHFERNDLPAARAALLHAIRKDRGDWALWYDFGVASTGAAKQRAYQQAARLNPLARNIRVLRTVGVLPKLPQEKR
jgi:tetratricopeptide (TPR) repeat protein